jgi:hypothetical protein
LEPCPDAQSPTDGTLIDGVRGGALYLRLSHRLLLDWSPSPKIAKSVDSLLCANFKFLNN